MYVSITIKFDDIAMTMGSLVCVIDDYDRELFRFDERLGRLNIRKYVVDRRKMTRTVGRRSKRFGVLSGAIIAERGRRSERSEVREVGL